VKEQVEELLVHRFHIDVSRWGPLEAVERRYPRLIVSSSDGEVQGVLGIGYCALGRGHAMVLGALAAQGGFRGTNELYQRALREVARCWLRNPTRPLYVIGATNNPQVYAGVLKRAASVYPSTELPSLDDGLREELAATVARYYGVERIASDNPDLLLFRAPDHARPLLVREPDSRDPAQRTFMLANPGFRSGDCLVFMIPCTWRNLVRTTLKLWGQKPPRLVFSE
jgi:hypothetical protein